VGSGWPWKASGRARAANPTAREEPSRRG
jgi:hypothetical protein